MTAASQMTKPDNDPLWYDRAEPDAPAGLLAWAMALVFVSGAAVFRLPGLISDAWGQNSWDKGVLRIRGPQKRP